MTSTRLILAAGTAAAALASVVPAVGHGGTAVAQQIGGRSATTTLVAPASAHVLRASLSGSETVAAATRLTVVRTTDGATLFTGSLATFRSLPIPAGTKLQVHVERPARYAQLKAAAVLQWS